MKHAYLIVAHQYPEQLVRLVDRLQSPDARFYIHIDKKVEHMMDDPHIKKLQNCYNVLIYSVLKTYWGGTLREPQHYSCCERRSRTVIMADSHSFPEYAIR